MRSFRDIDWPEQDAPRFWAFGTIDGEAQSYADRLFHHGSGKWLSPDRVAIEETSELITSEPDSEGNTRSLHALLTDDRQAFHIHLPHTKPGSVVDASVLKDPASHRLVFAMTGENPGMFEWAEATGPIHVEAENGISIAKGAVRGNGQRVEIPPYSLVAIELRGGIHHFHNVRALSYHRLNRPTAEQGDNITLNTQQWHGDLPEHFEPLKPQKIYRNLPDSYSSIPAITGENELKIFMSRAYEQLRELAEEKPDPDKDYVRGLISNMHILAQHCSTRERPFQTALDDRRQQPARIASLLG